MPIDTIGPESTGVNRRDFLVKSGSLATAISVSAACTSAADPGAPSTTTPGVSSDTAQATSVNAWEAEWRSLIAAAKQEGKLSVMTRPGETYRSFLRKFELFLPGITLEHQGLIALNVAPRLVQERKAGVYEWDVAILTATTPLRVLKPEGALDPIKPVIFHPEALKDASWQGGFDAGWMDLDKRYGYAYGGVRNRVVWINTDLIEANEIKTALDLLNPKWKGKIIAGDPRIGGFGNTATVMRLKYGDDIVRRLYKDQAVVVGREQRQMMELLMRGQYAIGVTVVNEQLLVDFLAQGVARNLKYIDMEDADYLSATGNIVFLFNRAPNPNAAKLFLNWLLTKEGQVAWVETTKENSRRLDVPAGNPDFQGTPGKRYLNLETEEAIPLQERTAQLAQEALN